MMKVFVGGIATETNTFSPLPTGLAAFEQAGLRRRGGPPGGAFAPFEALLADWAARDGHQLAFGLMAYAEPAGPTRQTAWETLRDELLADLAAELPVDAVLLPLHGAMVAERCDDCEGELLERVRALVGPDVPIGVELDPHCHFTERMRRHADILVAYKHYPHTDIAERLEEVWRLTLATAAGRIRPRTEVFDCRMVGSWHTTREPMRSFVQRMTALEGRDRVLSVNFGHGFPWGDVPEAGAKVWVTTDGDAALASVLAAELGREVIGLRRHTAGTLIELDAALDRVAAAPPGAAPLVLADDADNPGGGAPGDSSFVLRRLLQRGIANVALGAFWDLGAVQICHDAGVGASLPLRVGGKCGPVSGDPLDLQVTVRALPEAHMQSVPGSGPSPCGRAAWVATDDGIDLVLVSVRQQVFGTDLFTGLGIALAAKRAIVVKSSQHFHAAFAPIASDVIYVTTPGLLRCDFAQLPYRRRSLHYWPRVADPWAEEPGRG